MGMAGEFLGETGGELGGLGGALGDVRLRVAREGGEDAGRQPRDIQGQLAADLRVGVRGELAHRRLGCDPGLGGGHQEVGVVAGHLGPGDPAVADERPEVHVVVGAEGPGPGLGEVVAARQKKADVLVTGLRQRLHEPLRQRRIVRETRQNVLQQSSPARL